MDVQRSRIFLIPEWNLLFKHSSVAIFGAGRDLSQAGNICPKWTLLVLSPQEILSSCAATNGLRCLSGSTA